MRYLLAALLIYSAGVLPAEAVSSLDAIAYDYKSIDAQYEIQPDSSIKVEERITIGFEGTFHSLWRGVSLGPVAVSNVEVIDADTGEALKFVAQFPDLPNAPENLGTYAWINDNGYFKVQWHYSAADTTKTWVLRYTLRGAVAFLKDHDEFEWSLFSRYAVPVASTTVRVVLPAPAAITGELTSATGTVVSEEGEVVMQVGVVPAGGGVAFVARWPKGILHPPVHAFFLTEMALTYGLWVLLAPVLVLLILGGGGYWLYKKRTQ